jgi:hypothetical protein
MTTFQTENDAAPRRSQNLQRQHLEIAIDDLRKALQKYGQAVAPALGLWFSVPVVGMVAMQFRATSASLITALRTMHAEMQAAGVATADIADHRDEREG